LAGRGFFVLEGGGRLLKGELDISTLPLSLPPPSKSKSNYSIFLLFFKKILSFQLLKLQ
jgi:hypothetical protein